MKKTRLKTDCWIWMFGRNKEGYGKIGRNGKIHSAYKFMYELLIGKVPANCELHHICNTKLCVNPTHLEPVSHAENCRRGSQTKLTAKDVKEIRRISGRYTHREIAEQFGVTRQSISYILQGKRWV